MLNEDDIIKRLTGVCAEFQGDDYDEWAAQAIPVYQAILTEAGLVAFAVVAGQPDGDFVAEIVLRMPWGEEKTFPDPEEIAEDPKTTYTPKYLIEALADEHTGEKEPHCYIQQLVDFFMDLVGTVRFLNRQKNMLEADIFVRAASSAISPLDRDRFLRDAMRHISVAMMTVTIDGQRLVKKVMVRDRERLGVVLAAPAGLYWNEEQKEWRHVPLPPERIVGDAEPDDPRLIAARAAWKEVVDS